MAGKQVLSTHNLYLVLMGQAKLYREAKRKSDGFTFYTRMKTTPICLTQNVTATIFRPRGLFFICLVWVAFPMSIKGEFAVGLAKGNVLMNWITNMTDINETRSVCNPEGVKIIRFNPYDVNGTAATNYISKVTEIGNVSLGNVSFRLQSLTLADAGKYYYTGTSSDSADGGQVLVIAGIPANITVMEVSDPLENEKYTMKCSAQSTSVPLGMGLTMHYQWKRENGQNITSSNRYSFSSNQSNLIISPLQRQDAGNIVCEAWEHVGAVSPSALLSLKVIYGPDPGNIQLSPNRTSHEVTELSSLSVNCSTDCYPDCQYGWTGPDGRAKSDTRMLSISSVGKNQTGNYICTASNSRIPNKTDTSTITVVVLYPPVLTMKATNTSKGGKVVINCTASGVPDNYTFYNLTHMAPDVSRTIVRELVLTRVSNSDVSFTIENATYQDTGFYVCKASNGITHYNAKELVMEDIVSVWITDKPVITYNAKDFDAEKGKDGNMHIEFYSGLFQPLVTWYIVNNGTMELLLNSSHFRIYLAAVTVELKYYKKTIQLPGYNASLEVYNVNDEQFASYRVEINNSFAESVFVTLQLKPRGPPETPANLNVVPDSVTTHSLQLIWQAGFHGGASQTFVIEYREAGQINWLNKSEPSGFVRYVTLNSTITDLKDGTTYEFRIYSENVFNRSQISSTINETTKTVTQNELENPNGSSAIIGAVVGSVVALVISVAIVGFLFYKRRKTIKSPEDIDVLQDKTNLSDSHDRGLKDNPVYDSSGPLPDPSTKEGATGDEYATVVKPKTNHGQVEDSSKLYAHVDKTHRGKNKGKVKEKHGKAPREDIYENATLAGRDNHKGNMNANSGDLKTVENVYEIPDEASKGSVSSHSKKDGLMYADLMLDSPTTKNGKLVIRGLDNRTEYADIAYGKRGKPLLDNNEEQM